MPKIVTDQIANQAITSALLATAVAALLADAIKESAFTRLGTFTTGTTQPVSFADSLFTGKTAGGGVSGAGVVGIVAASFASSAAETGTGAGQAGLGAAAAADRPYPVADFPGQSGVFAEIRKADGDEVVLSDLLSTATGNDANAKVILGLSFRSDLAADAKWRGFFYYQRQSDGLFAPFTPDTSLNSVQLFAPEVWTLNNAPVRRGLTGTQIVGQAGAILGPNSVTTTELQNDAATLVKIGARPGHQTFNGNSSDTKFSLTNRVTVAAWYPAVAVYRNGLRIVQVQGAPSGLDQYRVIEESTVTKAELGAALPTGEGLIVDYLY